VTRGLRRVLSLQAALIVAFLLVGSATYYSEVFRHPVARMRGPPFTQNDVDEIARRPVQAPYEDLEAYRGVYQQLHREREWPALGKARLVAENQLALGAAVTLPATVQAIVAPEFNAKKRLDDSREQFRKDAFSVQPILDETSTRGALDHFPVRAGEDFWVYAGGGLWAAGTPYAQPQAGPLVAQGATTRAEYYFPLRVTYLGKVPIRELIFQVHFHYPAINQDARHRRALQTCFPQRHDGRTYTKEHALRPGESMDTLCLVTGTAGPSLEEASAFLRTIAASGEPREVGILQQYEFARADKPSAYARSLIARGEWIRPDAFECGANPLCRANQALYTIGILPILANLGLLVAIGACFAGSVLAGLGRSMSQRTSATFLLPGIGLAVAIIATFALFGGGLGALAAFAVVPFLVGGVAVGSALTSFLLSRSQ
jgi:hypothetical protein